MKMDKVMAEAKDIEVAEKPARERPAKRELPPKKEKPVKERPPKKEKPVKEKPVKEKPVKEKPPKKEKPVKEKPPKKEKPVKEKPVKKEKPVREKPVKAEKPAKKEKVISYRKHWWQFWKPLAPKEVEEPVESIEPIDEMQTEEEINNYEEPIEESYVESIVEPIVPAQEKSVHTVEHVQSAMSIWDSKVAIGGFNTTLKGYVATMSKSCKKILDDSTALNLTFGSAVVSMVDYKKPAFVTEMGRIKKGSLKAVDALYPSYIEVNGDGSLNAFAPVRDEYLKDCTIMIGITVSNAPYISQVFLHKDGNYVYGRFPSKPSAIALVTVEKDFK